MKSPDQIKKALECCRGTYCPKECPYYDECKIGSDVVITDFKEYVQRLESQVPRWIPVTEILPKGEVLAVSDRGTMHIGYIEYHTYDGVRMCMCEDYDSGVVMSGVTHWMLLPSTPEEASE